MSLPRIAVLACAVLSLSCGREAPVAVLRAELRGTPAQPGSPDHLALVWNDYDMSPPGSRWAIVQEISDTGGRPHEYTFNVSQPPPEAVMSRDPDTGGRYAIGVVLAYRDTNHNGVLDTIPVGGGPIDQVLGTSAPYHHSYGAADYYEVWYVEGTPPSDPPGLQPGFNLRGAAGVVPLDTKIPIPIHPAAVNNLFLCEAMDSYQGTPTALLNDCLGPGPLRVFATLDRMNGAEDAYIELYSGRGELAGAQVTLNGIAMPYDAANHSYSAYYPDGGLLIPGADNELRVAQTGEEDVSVAVRLDGAFTITSPVAGATFRWDQPIPMTWTEAAGATRYRIYQNLSYPTGGVNRAFWAEGTAFTFPPLRSDPGLSRLRSRLSVRTFHQTWDDNGTDFLSMNYASVSVSYTR